MWNAGWRKPRRHVGLWYATPSFPTSFPSYSFSRSNHRTQLWAIILFFLTFNLLTIPLAQFKVFLNRLTDDSIDRAMACFQEGLCTRKDHPSDFDSRRAQIACHSILRVTEKGSTAMTTVREIPRFWINLRGLVQSSNLTSVETTMTRVFCMQGALKFHYWLKNIIPAAIIRISNHAHEPKIWIDKFATDVQSFILIGGSATFSSSKYLPNLPYALEYKTTLPKRVRYNNTDQLASIMSSTLRCWLHFPSEEDTSTQLKLLDILLSKSIASILFLDKIWEMYSAPFGTVFKNDWALRRSKIKLTATLEDFEKEFSLHPFADTSSSSHHKLQDLSTLINQWMKFTGVESNTSEMVSRINL